MLTLLLHFYFVSYTQYYQYHNLSLLYSKNIEIYIILTLNNYILNWSQTDIYREVQLYTTCKVVNRMNDIHLMTHN